MADPTKLFLSTLAIRNFKSIGQQGVHIEISARRGLTGVLGANGSGKSVCMEALAFACGAAANELRVQSLQELIHGGVCPEVTVTWRSAAKATMTLVTHLTPDSGRVYRVDGKKVLQSELRHRLAASNMYTSFSYIRQAQVAFLVERSTPERLASIVSEVSGLALLAAAHQSTAKLLAARDAQLSQIRDNTQAMRRAIEGNSKKMKAALEYDKLKLEARGAGAAFRASLTACVAAVTEESARVGDAIEVLQTERSAIERVQKASDIFATGEEQTGQISEDLERAKQELQELQCLQQHQDSSADACSALQQELAAHESKVQAAQQDVGATRALLDSNEEACTHLKAQQEGSEVSCASFDAQLCAGIKALETLTATSDSHNSTLQSLKEAACKLQSALAAGLSVEACRSAVQQLQGRERSERALCERLQSQLSEASADRRILVSQLLLRSMLPAELRHRFGVHALLEVFGFKPAMQATVLKCEGALIQLMAPIRDVLLCTSVTEASRLLSAAEVKPYSVRLWPSDTIRFSDRSKAFRPGDLLDPLSLCDFHKDHLPAMMRAFGGSLIATSDDVASAATKRFGVVCVTVHGRRHAPGTLEGGSTRPSGPSIVSLKLQEQTSRHDVQRLCAASTEAHQSAAKGAVELAAAGVALADAETLESRAQRTEREVARQQVALDRSMPTRDAQAELNAQLQKQAESVRCVVAARGSVTVAALEAALRDALQARGVLQSRLDNAQAALQMHRARARAAAQSLTAMQSSTSAEAYDGAEQKISLLAETVTELEAKLEGAAQALAEKERLESDAAQRDSKLEDLQGRVSACTDQQTKLAGELFTWQEELEKLSDHLHEHEACTDHDEDDTADKPADVTAALPAARAACVEAKQQWTKLKAAVLRNASREQASDDYQLLNQKQAECSAAEERAQVLSKGYSILERESNEAAAMANDVNEHVFDAVALNFREMLSSVMPAVEFEAIRSRTRVQDGVTIRWRSTLEAANWNDKLSELSGGQRSLCTIAYMLAAFQAATATSLIMVDEIDAALDDVNQARVGELLRTCSGVSGCQVLAVSHSSSFHQACASFLKVTLGAAGTSVEVLTAMGEAEGQQKKTKRAKRAH